MTEEAELKERLFSLFSKEEILELLSSEPEKTNPLTDRMLTPTQKYYLSRKIPDSESACASCGQSTVNDNEHAIELLGGEKQ